MNQLRITLTASSLGNVPIDGTLRPDGSFAFLRVGPGEHTLRLTPGGTASSTRITVADRDLEGLELTAPPLLAGRVVVAGGASLPRDTAAMAVGAPPRSSIRIQARPVGTGGSPTAAVNADGSFLLSNVFGDYTIAMLQVPFGYYVKAMSFGAVDLMQAALKAPNAGETAATIRIELTTATIPEQAGVTVSGRVWGLSKEPSVAGRAILMQNAQAGQSTLVAARTQHLGRSDLAPDGAFEVRHVPPGAYTIELLGGKTRPVARIVVGGQDVTGVEILEPTLVTAVTPPPDTQNPIPSTSTLTDRSGPEMSVVQPGFKVSGHVVTTPGAMLPRAVALFDAADRSLLAPLASDGSFEFSKAPLGAYDLATLPLGRLPQFTRIIVDGTDVAGLRIETQPVAEAHGRVVTDRGNPLPPDLKLTLEPRVSEGLLTIPIEPDGSFSMRLPYGEYRLGVSGLTPGFALESIASGSLDLLAAPLKIDRPALDEIRIVLTTPSR